METVRQVPVVLGENRQYITPIDTFRGGNFVTAIISGANNYTSGQSLYSVVASSVVRGRPLNLAIHNRETQPVTLVFRDGSLSGAIFMGPITVNPTQQNDRTPDQLLGRRFTSGIYALVISGPAYAQGIDVTIGYVLEPDPTAVGGYLQ